MPISIPKNTEIPTRTRAQSLPANRGTPLIDLQDLNISDEHDKKKEEHAFPLTKPPLYKQSTPVTIPKSKPVQIPSQPQSVPQWKTQPFGQTPPFSRTFDSNESPGFVNSSSFTPPFEIAYPQYSDSWKKSHFKVCEFLIYL